MKRGLLFSTTRRSKRRRGSRGRKKRHAHKRARKRRVRTRKHRVRTRKHRVRTRKHRVRKRIRTRGHTRRRRGGMWSRFKKAVTRTRKSSKIVPHAQLVKEEEEKKKEECKKFLSEKGSPWSDREVFDGMFHWRGERRKECKKLLGRA